MRCVGGEVGATSSLAPKIGPLGLVSYDKKLNSLLNVKLILYFIVLAYSLPRKSVMILPKLHLTGKA